MFDSTGLLTSEIARNGFAGSPGPTVAAAYTTTLAYSSGHLSTVTDAAGRTLTYSYGTNGKVSGIADSTGRSVAYGYDGSGNLTDVTDVAAGNTHFTYDGNHFLLTVRDPRGNTVETNWYDSSGRAIKQKDGLSRETDFDYASTPGSTKVTDPNSNVTLDVFTNNQVTSETHGYGTTSAATWTYSYDPVTGGVATATDPNTNPTNYTWDSTGHPLTIEDALHHQTAFTYNSFGEPLTMVDALPSPDTTTTTYTYDSAGNLASISTPLLQGAGGTQLTTYTHGDASHPGDVTSITDPRFKVWSFSYDSSTGNLLSETTPLGDETTYTYDSAGHELTMVAPNGNVVGGNPLLFTTTYAPDAFGDVTSITDPLGNKTQQFFDADRNLHKVEDPMMQTTQYDYDAANELTTITRPDTTTLQNSYWPDGTLETQTDGNGKITQYAYNPLARLQSVTDPDSEVTQYTYDGAGNLKTVKDPALRTTTYGYDIANRLTSTTYSDGVTPNVSYQYDNDNQRTQMTDGSGQTNYQWDSLHRLMSQTDGASQTTSYGYDLANNETSITYPGSGTRTVARAFDDSGRLHTVTDWLTHQTTFNYDHDSNLTSENDANSTTATYTPDDGDRLMSIADSLSGTNYATFSYSRNADDLVTAVTPTGVGEPNESYGYSSLNQLNSVNSSSYTFDSADNMTSTPAGTNLAYDDANRLCWTATSSAACGSPPTGATTYSYGSNGERITMTPPTGNPTVNYDYDQAYRLTGLDGASYRNAVLASNPLGYWRLGETSGTTAADSSGNARNGTYTGGYTQGASSALGTDANKAVTFNGTTGYVDAGNQGVGQLSNFSVEAWVKSTATNKPWILAEGSTSNNNPVDGINIDGTGANNTRFFVRDTSGTSANVTGTKTINDGNWHMVVGVRNGTNFSLYVDGVPDGSTTATLGSIALNTTAIGALKRSTVGGFMNGSVDEAAWFPTSLSTAQISGQYQAAISGYAPSVDQAAPYAYWRLGEASGTTATDASANNRGGTYTGGFTLGATGPLTHDSANKAVTLNGTTGYVDVPGSGSGLHVGNGTIFTVEAWVKSNSTSNPWIVAEGSTSSNNPVDGIGLIGGTTSTARFFVRDTSGTTASVTGAKTINDNNWHFVVGVRNGSNFALYVDGQADGTTTGTLGSISENTTDIGVLKRASLGGFLNGSVDEAAYYQSVLSAATIAQQYHNATNATPTVATYSYNGDGLRTSKTVAGIVTPFTWLQSGGFPLLESDGTNQYIYGAGDSPLESIDGLGNVTYMQHDQQGSTRVLTNGSGAVVGNMSTDAYGNPTAGSGTSMLPLRYDGEYRDNETGFYYLRARYYDPSTGQFVSVDPAVATTRSAYGYAAQDPLNETDATGLCVGTNGHDYGFHNPCPWSENPANPKYASHDPAEAHGDSCPHLSDDGLECLDPAWNKAHPFGGDSPAYYYGCESLVVSEFCLDVTSHGGVFFTGGVGLATPGSSAGVGYINGVSNPSACQTNAFLNGRSVNAGGGIGVGGNVVWGNEGHLGGSDFGHEEGLTAAGGGAFQENTWGLLGNTGSGSCGC